MAAGSTYTPIQTYTVSGGSTSTITFSSISGSYTDLVLICSGNCNSGTDYPRLRVGNGSASATGYSNTQMYGTGTTATAYRETSQTGFIFATYPATSNRVTTIFNFMSYSQTTNNKYVFMRDNNAAGNVTAAIMLWQSTSAINYIELFLTNNFASGSTFTLYGIAAA